MPDQAQPEWPPPSGNPNVGPPPYPPPAGTATYYAPANPPPPKPFWRRPLVIVVAALAVLVAVVAVVLVVLFVLSPPVVEKASLESSISGQLSDADEPPQSVLCASDLEGVVGKTITCEVVINETNAFELIVETTKVEGSEVSYEMTPALSQAQLEKTVAELVADSAGTEPTGVTCEGGLVGEPDNKTSCSMELDSEPIEIEASVTSVEGLLMNFQISQV
ncbi:MAG: DUF4333 domain-containing protein [Mycobacterium sp.]